MSSYSWPNFNEWLQTAWGAGAEFWCSGPGGIIGGNFVYGQNPPYYLDNFQTFHPKFFGAPTVVANCSTVNGSPVITVGNINGLLMNQFVQGQGLPPSSIIIGLGNGTITINQNATL